MDNIFNLDETQSFNYYTVNKGDTLYNISKQNKINIKLLAALNGLNESDYIYPNQVLILHNNDYSYYITKEGDTIQIVSDTFKTDIVSIIKENPTIYLSEGQLIVNKINM